MALSVSVSAAAQWPQWRGPSRDGSIPATATPKWPASWNRAWRVDVGEGYSSPIVSGGRVFVHSRRDPEEIVTAIDFASGKVAWQQKYASAFTKSKYAASMAKGPYATPLVVGNTLITVGGSAVVGAWSTATGEALWRKDYSASVDTSKLFTGTAASPLSEGGLVIVQVGSDVGGGRVVALDPRTGAEKWTWKGKGPGYSSPVAFTIGGVRQIVTLTDGSVEGIDAKTGAALWSIPFPDEWHENIVNPVWTGTHLIVSGTRQGTQAYTVTQAAGKWQTAQVWKNAELPMYMSTPVLADGVLYGLSSRNKGQIFAMEAATGAVKWKTEGRTADQAAILLTANNVLVQTQAGELVVIKRSAARYEEEKRYTLADGATWAVPVVLADALVVRDASGVMKLSPSS